MKRGDLLIYLFIIFMLLSSFLIYFFLNRIGGANQRIKSVVVEYKRQVFTEIPLPSEKRTVELKGSWGVLILNLDGYKIRVNPASPHYCPDKICMNQGWISEPPQTIVCLPNRIIIYYRGGAQIDGLTH
ncbi:MAG: hypothetical protein DDT40_00093 [candidate division WS2 bacterium]|uniref:NusG domain-containing protein n=1 Tax=Psychracetigena formicireducens TaxID=2986056 RepID=A0A9E2F668_PSYF1|nr:hypothetical protein [Candidatus Psychracetigena formicireducens]MBT9144283.1 hypothetical protein [Candidatus Psychracetigena formicireducens]MBT9149927.1 hypothetical protein [Candidatus Psychracetigena formicireducens]